MDYYHIVCGFIINDMIKKIEKKEKHVLYMKNYRNNYMKNYRNNKKKTN